MAEHKNNNEHPSHSHHRSHGVRHVLHSIRRFFYRVGEGIGEFFFKLSASVKKAFRNVDYRVHNFFRNVGNSLSKLFKPVGKSLNKLNSDTSRMLNKSARATSKFLAPIDKFFKKITDSVAQAMRKSARAISKFLAPINKFFHKLFSPVAAFFKRTAKAVSKKRSERRAEIDSIPTPRGFIPSVERLRIILMFFMCIDLFGFPTMFGGIIQYLCGFVPIAFFILSGYLVLREDEDRSKRIVRAIKRCAIVFGILTVSYFALNLLYYRLLGINIFAAFANPRLWLNFLVFNVWQFDIGSAIWYVQSLLYAYIIIYFLDKLKLLRFDYIIAAVCIIFTICTGELAGVFKWNVLGYTYMPGNFITRALPYTLLGGFIRRNHITFKNIKSLWYIFAIFAGCFMMLAEILILGAFRVVGYYGHLIGMPVVAVAVCMLAFKSKKKPGFEKYLLISRHHVNLIYYLCQPVSVFLVFLIAGVAGASIAEISGFMGIITFFVCLLIAIIIARISFSIKKKKRKSHETEDKALRDSDRNTSAV